jgi:hypothetical protein
MAGRTFLFPVEISPCPVPLDVSLLFPPSHFIYILGGETFVSAMEEIIKASLM